MLFDDSSLIREWGRIGKPGRRRIELYRDHSNARIALNAWLARKVRRGYKTRPLYETRVLGGKAHPSHGALLNGRAE